MEFKMSKDDGLCRYKENEGYTSYKDGEWCFNGYAYGAFMGFESADDVSEAEAAQILADTYKLTLNEAKGELTKEGLSREESIKFLMEERNWSAEWAMKSLGLNFTAEEIAKFEEDGTLPE